MIRMKQGDFPIITGPSWPGVSYFCSTRQGGVSQPPWDTLNVGLHTGDHPAHVEQNRRRVAPAAGPVVWLDQVHGTDVLDADADSAGQGVAVQADAAITSRVDRVLAIMVADCLPVVMGSEDGLLIGVAHAGWRGLAAGVLENTLHQLQARHPEQKRAQWRAWIGPGISQRHFEVGDEVRRRFMEADPQTARFFKSGKPAKWMADLPGIARHRLKQAGIHRVDVSALCTADRPDLFFSYRRDGVTGRQVVFAWRNP